MSPKGKHHLHIGAGGRRQGIEIDGAQLGQAILHMGGDPRLAGRALVAKARFERGAGAGVEAKAAGRFGRIGQHRFGHAGEQGFGAGVCSGRLRQGAGGERRKGEGGGAGDEEIAAGGRHWDWVSVGIHAAGAISESSGGAPGWKSLS